MTSALASLPAPRPASASLVWVAAAASLLLVLGLILTGRGELARLAIPAGAALVALTLYFRHPIGYVHFTLWTWFLTPFVRRIVDWRVGFEDHNLVLVAPLLVSAIAGLTLLRRRRLAGDVRLTPFFFCIAGILYGFAVGLMRWRLHASGATTPAEIVYGLFDWLAPLLFGLHLYLRWPMYEEHKRAIQTSFLWALLILGTYGLYQFFIAPAWDCYWLVNVMQTDNTSFGRPEPLSIRVWSTLNAPGPFAEVLLIGTVLVPRLKSTIKLPALVAGYASFLLTLIRTCWLSWLIAQVIIMSLGGSRQFRRILFVFMTCFCCLGLLALLPATSGAVTERFSTFTHIGGDESFEARSDVYKTQVATALETPFGHGLVSDSPIDSGIIMLVTSCGWLGSLTYIAGLMMIVGTADRRVLRSDAFALEGYALSMILFAQLVSGNSLVSATGAMLWICVGSYLSASTFQRQTLSDPAKPSSVQQILDFGVTSGPLSHAKV